MVVDYVLGNYVEDGQGIAYSIEQAPVVPIKRYNCSAKDGGDAANMRYSD